MVLRFNNALKALISARQNIFEGLNIRYFGPFDGHDVGKIVKVLNEIKNMNGPRILHLRTVKGKGFEQAEKDPTTHGMRPVSSIRRQGRGSRKATTGFRIGRKCSDTRLSSLQTPIRGWPGLQQRCLQALQ